MPLKPGKMDFAAFTGKITTDSYSATIKKLAIASQKAGCFAQLAPCRVVAGKRHLNAALEHTFSAIGSGQNFAKKPELEFLIRLLGEKQLDKVFEKARFGNEPLLLVVEKKKPSKAREIMKEIGFVKQKFPFGKNMEELMHLYSISEKGIETLRGLKSPLEELVIEKTSFVAMER